MGNSILIKLFLLVSLGFFYGDCKSHRMPRLSIQGRRSKVITTTSVPSASLSRVSHMNLKTYNYTQRLDHFNFVPQSYATFQQRYMVDFSQWGGPGAPIFASLGGESSIDDDLGPSFLPENAPKFRALIVYIEHRYYGKSIPFGSREEATRNATRLGYLNSAQALADYAEVLLHIQRTTNSTNSPIIVIGGSYGGMLVSWFRLKYPHIAFGALASSAPILDLFDSVPIVGYYDVVSTDFNETSRSCYETISKSWTEIHKLGSTPEGLSYLTSKFKFCNKLNASDDVKDYLVYMYGEAAQYDDPINRPVETICAAIDRSAKKTDVVGQIAEAVFSYMGNHSCYDIGGVSDFDEDSAIQWDWQVCTELGQPDGLDRKNNSMFPYEPFDFRSYMDYCYNSYGVWPTPQWVPNYYGGRHNMLPRLREFGSNIIFSNGLRDPYSAGGVLESVSDTIVALTTDKGSHCLDLGPSSADDPEWLRKQREKEVEIISEWIRSESSVGRASDYSLHETLKLVYLLVAFTLSILV